MEKSERFRDPVVSELEGVNKGKELSVHQNLQHLKIDVRFV
jgi:hypothetical protein